ncbi:hypothetical protein NDU88_002553 [Pleurodeles waltl]|uniref:Uncharacterized protein n=1 Tax=Pleurodeles waltl TaxID=8319 RepID=A0AAV7TMY5_PLEWA|nr:hypothetical protein NDU88_002553 [Pleurodeles waltl]
MPTLAAGVLLGEPYCSATMFCSRLFLDGPLLAGRCWCCRPWAVVSPDKEVTEIGNRVNDLERTVDACAEDQEMLWRCMVALDEQYIELQLKQEDLEDMSRQNNIRIWSLLSGEEGTDIGAYTGALLQSVRGHSMQPPAAFNRAHRVGAASGRPNVALDILTQIHYFTEKEVILQAATLKSDIQYQGHKIL